MDITNTYTHRMNPAILRNGITCLILIIFPSLIHGQNNPPTHYGFRHLQTTFKGDTVDILIKSKKGEETKKKPLFLFCQGSLPIPLIIVYDTSKDNGIYSVFPFNADSLSEQYHLVIISKPYVPLMINQNLLNSDLTYTDNTGKYPRKYVERNLLEYYVDRNKQVLLFLQKQSWVSKKQLIVAGHSEGSTIAAKLAIMTPAVTALIYSAGNPMGRIMTIIERSRQTETNSVSNAETVINNWENIAAHPESMEALSGDPNKTTWQFSIPPINYLKMLKIPVLVTYGSKDASAPFNDYLRVETISTGRKNFTFKTYIGTEHNYFPLKKDGSIDYDIFNWDKVAADWRRWLAGEIIK